MKERRVLTELDAWLCFSFNTSGSKIFPEAFCGRVAFPYGLQAYDRVRNIALSIPSSTHFTTLKRLHIHPYHFSLHTHIPSVPSESDLSPHPPPTDVRTGVAVSHTETAAIHLCHPYPHAASFHCPLLVTTRRHTDGPAPANICRDIQMFQPLQTHFSGCVMATKESRWAQIPHVLRTQTQLGRSCFDPLSAETQD